ncbi:putative membrane protein [Streptomyces sp. L-9-10]|uniref:hypothetical protein n=1 Tax=Streptomyces sp. L-9-10 TaxID=1478131 RepID=UPI00101B9912|nr:hypothetical protein [Streptomyces sp. L-9-10]RYJ27785.1 putative membrane protein [Streptomyces sp. L-9-10]
MRSGLLALRGAGAVAVLVATPVLGAVTAQAHDSVRVTVTPSAVAPGGEIEIRAEGCRNGSGAAVSRAFVAGAELRDRAGGALTGSTVIGSSVKEGGYEIDVRCDGHGHAGAGRFEVVAHAGQDRPEQHASPVAPVRAGGGGTAPLAADVATDVGDVRDVHEVRAAGDVRTDLRTDARTAAEATGPGTPHAVIGLVLAGVAAVAVALRSARRSRHSDRDSD